MVSLDSNSPKVPPLLAQPSLLMPPLTTSIPTLSPLLTQILPSSSLLLTSSQLTLTSSASQPRARLLTKSSLLVRRVSSLFPLKVSNNSSLKKLEISEFFLWITIFLDLTLPTHLFSCTTEPIMATMIPLLSRLKFPSLLSPQDLPSNSNSDSLMITIIIWEPQQLIK